MKKHDIIAQLGFAVLATSFSVAPLFCQSLQQRFSSYWTTEEGYESTVELHNNLVNEPLTVAPVLYPADGTAIQLGDIHLGPLGSASIPLKQALAEKGLAVPASGSAVFRYYRTHGGALSAETSILDPRNGLAYTIPSVERAPASPSLWGFYWLRSSDSEVYVAVQNVSSETVTVEPRLWSGGRSFTLPGFSIEPMRSKVLDLPDELGTSLRNVWSLARVGGIQLVHGAIPGALNVSAWIEDERLGYSNMTSFTGPPPGNKLFGAQVLLGAQDDLLALRRGLILDTEVLLWNLTEEPLDPGATFYYVSQGTVAPIALPLGRLAPHEIRSIDLSGLQRQGLIPAAVSGGTFEIQHSGPEGALMGRILSVSRDAKYGFYTSLEARGAGSFSGVHWSLQYDWNTLLTVANFDDDEDQVTVEFTYNGGSFVLPAFPLQPRQGRTLNLRKLLAEGLFDREGNLFPVGVDHGGYRVYSNLRPIRGKLVVKEHLASQRLQVAAPFYQQCDWVTSFYFADPSAVTLFIDETHEVLPFCQLNSGQSHYHPSGNLYPSDLSVASVSGTIITALAPGFTEVGGQTSEAGDEWCSPVTFYVAQQKPVGVCDFRINPGQINANCQSGARQQALFGAEVQGSSSTIQCTVFQSGSSCSIDPEVPGDLTWDGGTTCNISSFSQTASRSYYTTNTGQLAQPTNITASFTLNINGKSLTKQRTVPLVCTQ